MSGAAGRSLHRRAWIAGAVAFATLPLAAHGGSVLPEPAGAATAALARLAILTGFGVERVSVTGQDVTDESDIFAAMDLAGLRSMADLDAGGASRRIERLPWIDTARVRRVFPNAVEVHVTERRPFAVWRHDGGDRLVDAGGRVLGAVRADSTPHFRLVSGAGAPFEASALFSTLAGYAGLGAQVARAERVAGRRWTLHLANGAVVHLPAGGEAAALDTLARTGGLEAVLSQPGLVVDLRASGRMVSRATPRGRT